MAWSKRSIALALMPWGWSRLSSLAFAGHRQVADAPRCGGVDLYRRVVRWPPNQGHRGGKQEVHCTRADALGMVTIDLSGIRGWLPIRGRTRLRRGGLVSPNSSIATQLGTPWRGARGPLHSRGCRWHCHHLSFLLSRVDANSRTHPVAAGSTCIAE